MSEIPETPTVRTTATNPPATGTTVPAKPPRLYQVAAWVVIVAGILYIVTTIFFAGFKIAGHHGHHHHWHHQNAMVHHHRGPGGGPGGPGGPGAHVGFGGPGGPGSAVPGPGQPPASVAPSLTPGR
jgi:hypothetical protein